MISHNSGYNQSAYLALPFLTKMAYVYKNDYPMKKVYIILSILLFTSVPKLFSQENSSAEVYLITCSPGMETYSIYGHSALRIVIPEKKSDMVYNWGVFDFSAPNFAWKFAKGRLDYLLDVYPYNSFLKEYMSEKRSVYIQKINLEPGEIEKLFSLIAENLKPENIKYRYDFFYDDCCTRIRDLLEKSLGEKLLYSPAETKKLPTFRDKVGEYQQSFSWLDFGINLIMGIPADKKASLRDQMFLPMDLQKGLSQATINRGNKMIPLLQNEETVFEFERPEIKQNILFSPPMVFCVILILITIFSAKCKGTGINKIVDILLFSLFSVLALMMIFFNFFTDHHQMKWNLNIIWLNPLLILCIVSLIFNKNWEVWFKWVFYLSLIFLLPMIFFPGIFNNALIPLSLIIILRSSIRAGFEWNPFLKKVMEP